MSDRVEDLMAVAAPDAPDPRVAPLLDPANAWSVRVRTRLTDLSPELTELVAHLADTGFWNHQYKTDTPWKRRTKALLKADGAADLVRHAIRELAVDGSFHGMQDHEQIFREAGLKEPSPARALAVGFALAAGWLTGDADGLVRDLATVGRKNCQAMDVYYRVDDGIAGAAFHALGELRDPAALEELWTLLYDVPTGRHAQRPLAKAVKKSATRLKVPPHTYAERTVPRHSLEPDGTLVLGNVGRGAIWLNLWCDADLALHDDGRVTVTWIDEEGRATPTTAPFRIPHGHGARHKTDSVHTVRRTARNIEATVTAERQRLSELADQARTAPQPPAWTYADWARYYRDHPVTGVVTRTREWEYEPTPGLGFRPLDPGNRSPEIPATAYVRLRAENAGGGTPESPAPEA